MPDEIIVTLRYGEQERDFLLPAATAFNAMEAALKEALRTGFSGIRLSDKRLELYLEGQLLDPKANLEAYGIYDGAILEVRTV